MTQTDTGSRPTTAKLSLPTLTTMVVGSMVGAGVFSLPSRFAQETGAAGALIAWAASRRELAVALLATVYTAFLIYAAGLKYLLVYAPATALFVKARKEQGRRLFSPPELLVLAVSVAGAVLGVVALALGWISL